MEELKNQENIMNQKFIEEQEDCDDFMRNLEKEYVEAYTEVENIKNQNIRDLRSASRGISTTFEKCKGDFYGMEQKGNNGNNGNLNN